MKVSKLFLILLAMVILLGSACVQSKEDNTNDISIEASDEVSTTTTSTSQKKTFFNDPDTLVIAVDNMHYSYGMTDLFINITQNELNKLLKAKGASYQIKFVNFTKEYAEKMGYAKSSVIASDNFAQSNIDPRKKALFSQMRKSNEYDMIGSQLNFVQYLAEEKKSREQVDLILLQNRIHIRDPKQSNPYLTAIDKGLFLELSEYLISQAGTELTNAISPGSIDSLKVDSKIFALCQSNISVNALAINKNFIDKYNLKLEDLTANINDYQPYLKKELAEYGKATAFLRDMTSQWNNIHPDLNCLSFHKGKALASLDLDIFQKTYLDKFKLVKESLATSKANLYEAKQISIYETSSQSHLPQWYQGEGGSSYYLVPQLDFVRSSQNELYAISSWTKNKQQALDFLNRLYLDQEIANLMSFGLEGKDFEIQNGKARKLDSSAYFYLGGGYFNSLISASKAKESENKLESYLIMESNKDLLAQAGFSIDYSKHFETINSLRNILTPSQNEWQNKVTSKISSFNYKNEAEVKEGFKDFRQILTSCGIDELIKDYNQQYQEFLKQDQ